MNTKQAEYKTDIANLAGRTDAAIERLRADMARETSALGWRIILFTIAIVGLATAILAFLIRMPSPA